MFQRKKLLLPETPAEVEFKNCNVTTIGERCFSQKILKREFILMMGMWLDCDPIYFSNNQILKFYLRFRYSHIFLDILQTLLHIIKSSLKLISSFGLKS